MTPAELASKIARLDPNPPLTAAFEIAIAKRLGPNARPAWYRSQKEHWQGWLREYDGPGAYDRKIRSGRTAAFAYNHIVHAPMLLWLAEASGVEKSVCREATKTALAAPASLMSMSAAIRRVIPFEQIEERLMKTRRP